MPTPGVIRPAPPRLVGSGPVARIVGGDSAVQSASLLAARTKIERAQAELRAAEADLADARSMRKVARELAQRLQEDADEAQLEADAAGRVYVAATQGDGTTYTSMDAVFGSGKDLLAGLGGVARVTQISGDAGKLLEIAAEKTKAAEAAQERADLAWAAVDDIPVDELQSDVASAERAVTAARTALADLQARAANESRLASSSIALIDSLPSDAGQLSDQGWAQPVAGRQTDGFGPRPNKPLAGVNEFHRGTDIAAGCRTPVFAATDGVVVEARPNGTYGNWILIDHGSGVSTGYAHLIADGILVSAGQSVAAGALIGAVGSTGASTGCHLHFEVRLGGVAVDAVPFMAARGVSIG
jgi:murein DD-endopeptidase MepM/ murein hydrolase activator NlpD